MEFVDRFFLGELSKELFVSKEDAPLFEKQAVRMAGITEATDEYLCARKGPSHYTVVFTTEGTGELETSDGFVPLHSKSMIALKKGQDFRYRKVGEKWKIVWFILEDHRRWNHLQNLPLTFDNMIYGERIMHMLFLVGADVPRETKLALNRDLLNFLTDSLRLPGTRHPAEGRLDNLFFEVGTQLQYDWNVTRLAERMHSSEATLHRLCQKHLGISPMQKVLDLRIRQACFLLTNTEWKLNDVARQIGYGDGFNLSKAFKKRMGVSPEEFRKGATRSSYEKN